MALLSRNMACAGIVALVSGSAVAIVPVLRKGNALDALIKEAMSQFSWPETPPSFKSIFLRNLSGVPVAAGVLALSLGPIFAAHKMEEDSMEKKFTKSLIVNAVTLVPVFLTLYATRSIGLTLLNSSISIYFAKGCIKKRGLLAVPILSAASLTLCSIWEAIWSSKEHLVLKISYQIEKNKLYQERFQQLLDYNDGAARNVYEISRAQERQVFLQMGKTIGCAIASTVAGSILGGLFTQGVSKIVSLDKKQKANVSRIGALFAGALTFYSTQSVGLSVINAAACAFFPNIGQT